MSKRTNDAIDAFTYAMKTIEAMCGEEQEQKPRK